MTQVFKLIHGTILTLTYAEEYLPLDGDELFNDVDQKKTKDSKIEISLMSPPDMALRLFLQSAQAAALAKDEDLCYEFFVQALMVYEDSISESKAQVASLTLIIGYLYETRVFCAENLETLVSKCALHSSRLLKRIDQSRGVLLVSHLFWNTYPSDIENQGLRESKRVMECLQKAMKIADSVMDRASNISLLVEILERCLWYYNNQNDAVRSLYKCLGWIQFYKLFD